MVFRPLFFFFFSTLLSLKGRDSAKFSIQGERFGIQGERFGEMPPALQGERFGEIWVTFCTLQGEDVENIFIKLLPL